MAQALTPVPAPERELARHMVRLAVPVTPVVAIACGVAWGIDGALSAGFGIALVLLNLLASAALLTWAAGISPNALMAAALGGFLARMAVVMAAVTLVRDQPWVELVPLALTVLVTNLALLAWECRHVSATLAYPVHKPRRTSKGA